MMLLSWTYGITDDTAQALPSSKYRIHLFFGAFSVLPFSKFPVGVADWQCTLHNCTC